MFLVISFFFTLFFLIGSFFLTALINALRRIHKRDAKKHFRTIGALFFYRPIHLFFFPNHEYESLYFAAVCAQNITRFCYAASAVIFLSHTQLFSAASMQPENYYYTLFWIVLCSLTFLILSFVVGDYLARIFGSKLPEKALYFCVPIASVFLLITFPLTYVFLKLTLSLSRNIYFDHYYEPAGQAKQEIIEMIQEAELSPTLDTHDKKLIESVLTFRDRIAREVMVPRVDVFSLSADTTIKEAARILHHEGYSRIPVYRNTVDNIVGVLMYKDILTKFMEADQKQDLTILDAPIETIQKNVLYTPETKKISSLLQDFRKKQVHLAIVVDEYGGTEGIVTIEDILEEIVGDIADEYDRETALFIPQPDGSWIVDARMNILDIEEELGIKIPEESDYETVGGYIFHCTGSIPSKGFILHRDEFEIEIVSSNDRSIDKVRIKPLQNNVENDHDLSPN